MAGISEKDYLFGVYFITDNTDEIDENEIKEDFSEYGPVVFVKQIQSRIYVNFRSKTDAEKCLQDTTNKYGEMRRGRFGPKETQNSAKSGRSVLNTSSQIPQIERKPRNSHGFSQSVDSSFDEKDSLSYDVNLSENLSTEDVDLYRGNRNHRSPGIKPDIRKSNDTISPRSSKENNKQENSTLRQKSSRIYNSSENYEALHDDSSFSVSDDLPPLLSAPQSKRSAPMRSSVNSSNGRPPLLPTPPLSSLLPSPSIPPLFSPRVALKMNMRPRQNDSDCQPPLVSTKVHRSATVSSESSHNSISIQGHQTATVSSQLSDDSFDSPPPLVSTQLRPLNDGKIIEHTSPQSYEYYYRKYGNHILMANVPDDTTSDEIEKVLYPHIPIYVSEPEVTNIRMKVLFCHVQFSTGEEACRAANQVDGVELRQHRLTMIRLHDLMFNNTLM